MGSQEREGVSRARERDIFEGESGIFYERCEVEGWVPVVVVSRLSKFALLLITVNRRVSSTDSSSEGCTSSATAILLVVARVVQFALLLWLVCGVRLKIFITSVFYWVTRY